MCRQLYIQKYCRSYNTARGTFEPNGIERCPYYLQGTPLLNCTRYGRPFEERDVQRQDITCGACRRQEQERRQQRQRRQRSRAPSPPAMPYGYAPVRRETLEPDLTSRATPRYSTYG